MTDYEPDLVMADVEREASALELEDRTREPQGPREPMASCTTCSRSVRLASAFLVDGRARCAECVARDRRQRAAQRPQGSRLVVALVSGLVGALVGGAIWAVIAIATDMEVGYVAVLVGFLTGLGVRFGAGTQRGPALQYLAVALSVVGLLAAKYMVFAHVVVKVAHEKGFDAGYFHHTILTHFPDALVETLSPFDALFLFLAMSAAYRVPRADP